MADTWSGNLTEVEGAALGRLAVIAPLLERMGVAVIIDRHLPVDPQAEFTHGRLLGLLLAARVWSPVALSHVVEWAGQSGADILWNIAAGKLNDDRLGRSLDAFFPQRHSILSSLALQVAEEFDVPLKDLHDDPTHVLFTGASGNARPREGVVGTKSNSSTESHSGTKSESGTKSRRGAGPTPPVRSDGTLEPAHITVGRARDDVPHVAKMIHVGLGVPVDQFGPLPICGHTILGNQNGRTAVPEQTELLRQHLPALKLTILSDRGTYSVGHLRRLQDAGCDAISSVPWGEFRALFDTRRKNLTWKRSSHLSIEQQRQTEPSPTYEATLTATPSCSSVSKYSFSVLHCSVRPLSLSFFAASFPSDGAADSPSPSTSVVTPCRILLGAPPSSSSRVSECEWMSMNPGETISPDASISRVPDRAGMRPTATIRLPCTATSPWNQGFPVPSTMRPFRMTRSYDGGSAARTD